MVAVISITNQKGGVGKTTTALNLASALEAEHKRVLLIDNDPQGNLTASMGFTLAENFRPAPAQKNVRPEPSIRIARSARST